MSLQNDLTSSLVSATDKIQENIDAYDSMQSNIKLRSPSESIISDTKSIANISTKNKIGGLICVLICVLIWVIMSEIIPLFDTDWDHPFFLRYWVNGGYIWLLLVWYIIKIYRQYRNKKNNQTIHEFGIQYYKRMFISSIGMSLLLLMCAYIWYVSLSHTTASVNNTIYQSNVAFVYLISIVFLKLKVTCQKNLGVLLSLFGLIIICLGNDILNLIFKSYNISDGSNDSNSNTAFGMITAMISMIIFAIEEILLEHISKKYFDNNVSKPEQTFLFLGFMGIATFITCWPWFFIFNWTNIEKFSFPPESITWIGAFSLTILDGMYYAMFFLGISLTNAVFMSMGQIMVIPVSFFADIIFHGIKVTFLPILGSFFIILGFIFLEIDVFSYIKNKRKNCCNKRQNNDI